MKTQVLTIQRKKDANTFDVWMAIATYKQQFIFTVKLDKIAGRQLQIITYDSEFGKTFKFNQHIIGEVLNLVRQIVGGSQLDFPVDVGDFGTAEEAIALQKSFPPRLTLLKNQLPNQT